MLPFAASNFDSPLAAQTEARNGSEWHMNDIFCTNSCSVHLQLGNMSTIDAACPSFCKSKSLSQFRRCLFCKAQMDQPSASREGPATKVEIEAHLGTVALFDSHACAIWIWSLECGGAFCPFTFAKSLYTSVQKHQRNQIRSCDPQGLLSGPFSDEVGHC